MKKEHTNYLVLTLIILCLAGCISKQRIKNNIVENTITEKLNNDIYKIYTKINAYSKIKEDDELFLNEAVELEAVRLCKSQNNIAKIKFHIQGMEEDRNYVKKNYITSITAIIRCKTPKGQLFSIINNDENNQSLKVYGIIFRTIEEMNNVVNTYMMNYQSNNCKENNKLEYVISIFQLIDDIPYFVDESNADMLGFVGYKIDIDKNC